MSRSELIEVAQQALQHVTKPPRTRAYISMPLSVKTIVDGTMPNKDNLNGPLAQRVFEGLIALHRHREEEWIEGRFFYYQITQEHRNYWLYVGFTEIPIDQYVTTLLKVPEELVQACRNHLTGKRDDGGPWQSSSPT